MQNKNLNKEIGTATKWSTITEICTKLVTPITNMLLARLLNPEAFGIVATITLIITFAEIFTDAGFQKYIVQYDFKNEKELNQCTNLAFWINLTLSIFIWLLIALFASPIANLVGASGHEMAIIVISAEIPLLAFSSIQMARFRRNFDFKSLFYIRTIIAFIPLVITIPLAFIFKNYWSLIFGTLAKDVINAVALTVRSTWKPSLSVKISQIKKLLSFSIWTTTENITIWLSRNIGTFIIGGILGTYYLGLYKTATTTINSYFGVIQSAVMPVLFSALSRYQNDEVEFRNTFYRFHRMLSLIIIPLGFGIFVYRDLAVTILLGSQWEETSLLLGLSALMQSLLVIFSYYNSEAFRSKGRPNLSVIAQLISLCFTMPVLYFSANNSFESLSMYGPLIRIALLIATNVIAYIALKFTFTAALKNVWPSLVASLIMAIVGFFIRTIFDNVLWEIFTVVVCICVYIICLYMILFKYTKTK